ncbi:hypothetical protein P8452_58637 [Trifolium repens]|nr:hypothetical protein P8452_58637 [Trifolium repens]
MGCFQQYCSEPSSFSNISDIQDSLLLTHVMAFNNIYRTVCTLFYYHKSRVVGELVPFILICLLTRFYSSGVETKESFAGKVTIQL